MKIARVVPGSLVHVARHGVSMEEIEQAFFNTARVGRNKRRGSADFVLLGKTDGGRRIRVNFVYEIGTGTARAISAWEVR